MALTTEQVFALGILYNKLATTVYGEDGPKANNFQNATMYPLMEVAQLILRAHTEHRMTPELDRLIAQTYSTITEDDMQNEFAKLLPIELQGAFALGYYHGQAEKYSDIKPLGLKAMRSRANLTAQQVADKLGVSLRQYQRIESGENKASIQAAQTLASLFQCSVNDLF